MLAHLSDLKDWRIADGEPDIRGWLVALPDGRLAGRVEDLIVDTDDMSVRYLELKVLHEVIGTDDDTYLLVPVSAARLDDEDNLVIVDRLPKRGIAEAPRFARGVPTPAQERAIHDYYETPARASQALKPRAGDQRRFWGTRRAGREDAPYFARRPATPPPVEAVKAVEAVVIEEVVVEGIVEPPATAGRARGGPAKSRQQGDAHP
jgi:hypothetical protein